MSTSAVPGGRAAWSCSGVRTTSAWAARKPASSPRQLGLQIVRELGQSGDVIAPGCGLLGIGRGQGQGGQPRDSLIVIGEVPGGLGLGIGPEQSARVRTRRWRSKTAPLAAITWV